MAPEYIPKRKKSEQWLRILRVAIRQNFSHFDESSEENLIESEIFWQKWRLMNKHIALYSKMALCEVFKKMAFYLYFILSFEENFMNDELEALEVIF